MPSSASIEGLSDLLPDGTPPLRLTRAAFARADGRSAFISINIDVSEFVRGSDSSVPVDATIVVVDQTGRSAATAREQFIVEDVRAARDRDMPIELRTHIDLPAGDYEIRVSVADDAGTKASVFSQIVVPDFATDRLSLSDMVVDQPGGDVSPVAPFVPAMPTSVRVFGPRTPAIAFFQIYQGTARTDRLLPVAIQTRIVDVHDRVVHETSRVLDAETFKERRVDYRQQIPVHDLAPGEYLLSVVAIAGDQTTNRAMRFQVQ